jgi:hypothetical protein
MGISGVIELASDAQRQTHLHRGGVLRRFPLCRFGLFLGVLGAHRGHLLGDRLVLVTRPSPDYSQSADASGCSSRPAARLALPAAP